MPARKKGKDAPFQPSGDVTRVISLNEGHYAYVFDGQGKTHHVKRNSPEMVTVCREADAQTGGRISARLEEMGWIDVLERLNSEAYDAD